MSFNPHNHAGVSVDGFTIAALIDELCETRELRIPAPFYKTMQFLFFVGFSVLRSYVLKFPFWFGQDSVAMLFVCL